MSTLNCKNIQYPAGTGTIVVPSGTKIVSSVAGGIYAPGNVIQTIQNSLNTQVLTTSTSYVTSGLSVTITPTNASSKILITCFLGNFFTTAGSGGSIAFYRNGSQIFNPSPYDATGAYQIYASGYTSPMMQYLDSPGSNSALTYTLYFRTYSTGTTYINGQSGVVTAGTSIITVQEIGG